jgi:hypothetical protein
MCTISSGDGSGFCLRFDTPRGLTSFVSFFVAFDIVLTRTFSFVSLPECFRLLVIRFPPTAFRRLGRSFSDSLKEENDSSPLNKDSLGVV